MHKFISVLIIMYSDTLNFVVVVERECLHYSYANKGKGRTGMHGNERTLSLPVVQFSPWYPGAQEHP